MMTIREQVEELRLTAIRRAIEIGPPRDPGDALTQAQLERALSVHIEGLWDAIAAVAAAIDGMELA